MMNNFMYHRWKVNECRLERNDFICFCRVCERGNVNKDISCQPLLFFASGYDRFSYD